MNLYADDAGRRGRQIFGDVVALLMIALFIWLAVTVRNVIAAFGELGIRLQDAGNGFSGTMSEIGEALGGVPLIGDTLADAGEAVRGAVDAISLVAAFAVAALPIMAILLIWVLPRLKFASRSRELRAMSTDPAMLDLLALRALMTAPVRAVAAQHPDAAGAWRRGDPELVRRLAALELQRGGVTLRS